MRQKITVSSLAVLCVGWLGGSGVLWSACKTSEPSEDVVDPGAGEDDDKDDDDPDPTVPPAPYDTLAFDVQILDGDPQKRAGLQGRLVQAPDGTLYYAYFKRDAQGMCDIAVFGGTSSPVSGYSARVAIRQPLDTAWRIEKVPLERVGAADNVDFVTDLFGIDAAVDPSNGVLTVVMAAGGSSGQLCGSSDLVVATRTPDSDGGGTWDVAAPVTGSGACCPVCEGPACCADPACVQGSNAGAWAAAAVGDGGQRAVAFVDLHVAWDEDGSRYPGLEVWEEPGAVVTGIRPWSGKGLFGALEYVDGVLTAAYTSFAGGGLFVARRTGVAGQGDAWQERDLLPSFDVRERVSMAVAPNGTLGIAVSIGRDAHLTERHDLYYCASADGGITWPPLCENVDEPIVKLGQNPSLAYDSQSRPHLSYYVCGAGEPCGGSSAGLRYAWRERAGKWWTFDVHAGAQKGFYSQLALDPNHGDAPVIVYTDLSTGAAMVAQGRFSDD